MRLWSPGGEILRACGDARGDSVLSEQEQSHHEHEETGQCQRRAAVCREMSVLQEVHTQLLAGRRFAVQGSDHVTRFHVDGGMRPRLDETQGRVGLQWRIGTSRLCTRLSLRLRRIRRGPRRCILQVHEEGEKMVAYASRSLLEQEKTCTPTELEAAALIWALETFRPYINGVDVTILTDHAFLEYIRSKTNRWTRLEN